MKDEIYTVDQVAESLDLHPKTIRRFIKDGKLKANKIGNQWRVTETDLKAFTTGENINSLISGTASNLSAGTNLDSASLTDSTDRLLDPVTSTTPPKVKAQVTSIIDVFVDSREEADRIANTLLAVMIGKDPEYGMAKFDHIFYESEMKVKLILHGQPLLISMILGILAEIVD